MEYFNEDEILHYFQKEIEEVSARQIKKLQQEIEAIKAKELERIEQEVKAEVSATLGHDLEVLKVKHRRTLNDIITSSKRDMIAYREQLLQNIIEEVKTKISAYVKTSQYGEAMMKKIQSLMTKYPKQLTIGIAPHDDVLANLLRDQKSMIKIDPSIELGGIIGYVENQGVTIDESLDLKLKRKTQWFYEHSRLFIEE